MPRVLAIAMVSLLTGMLSVESALPAVGEFEELTVFELLLDRKAIEYVADLRGIVDCRVWGEVFFRLGSRNPLAKPLRSMKDMWN